MATSGSKPVTWPFEYKGWKVTFYVYHRDKNITPRLPAFPPNLWFAQPDIEHYHEHDKQNVRWTRRHGSIDITKPPGALAKGWKRANGKEQLCCFICAVYMPDEIYDYFEKCREMVKCTMME